MSHWFHRPRQIIYAVIVLYSISLKINIYTEQHEVFWCCSLSCFCQFLWNKSNHYSDVTWCCQRGLIVHLLFTMKCSKCYLKAYNGTKISDRAASPPSQHVSHFVMLELGIWLKLRSRWVRINKFSWQKRCNFGIYFVLNDNLISTFFRFILIISIIDSE